MAEYINNTEYIDRKELVNNINKFVKFTNKDEQEWVKDECIRQAYCIQKADVVPRSEVEEANLLIEMQESLIKEINAELNQAKQEIAREIFKEMDNLIITLELDDNEKASVLDYNKYDELKKKRIGD